MLRTGGANRKRTSAGSSRCALCSFRRASVPAYAVTRGVSAGLCDDYDVATETIDRALSINMNLAACWISLTTTSPLLGLLNRRPGLGKSELRATSCFLVRLEGRAAPTPSESAHLLATLSAYESATCPAGEDVMLKAEADWTAQELRADQPMTTDDLRLRVDELLKLQ